MSRVALIVSFGQGDGSSDIICSGSRVFVPDIYFLLSTFFSEVSDYFELWWDRCL